MEQLKKLVLQVRKNPALELEVRLGKIVSDRFNPGVDATFFEALRVELEACNEVYTSETWKEEMDVFFQTDSKEMRTRVSYPSHIMSVKSTTIQKKRVVNVDFTTDAEYDLRVALSEEIPVTDVAAIVLPTAVRLKHVKRYYYRHGDVETNTWCFELSKTWTAPSRTEAEDKQYNDIPVYEIECELTDTREYVSTHSDKYIATSLMMKACDLLGNANANYKVHKKNTLQRRP